jgi:glutaredoxin
VTLYGYACKQTNKNGNRKLLGYGRPLWQLWTNKIWRKLSHSYHFEYKRGDGAKYKMKIPALQQNGYTVYTKSECGWCRRTKVLLPEAVVFNCDKHLEFDKDAFLTEMAHRIGKEYRTFPMVFFEGVFIGGYEDTQDFVDFDITKDF